MNSEIRRILFIRTDRIGDVLMNLPAIHLLRQTHPKAHITVLLEESLRGLLEGHPDIDLVRYLSSKKVKTDFLYWLSWVRFIKKSRFDFGVVSNPNKMWHAALFFGGVPMRLGYDRKWPFFLTHKIKLMNTEEPIHEIEKNLNLIKLVSKKEWDGKIELSLDPMAKDKIDDYLGRELLSELDLVVIHPGTSNLKKRWAEEKFAKIGDLIQSDKDLKVILVGGKEEIETSKKVASLMRTRVIDWTGELSLRELIALFSRSNVRLVISVDSGPVHLAWINKTPVVAMYAQNVVGSDPRRWGPRDCLGETLFKAMDEITVDEVYGLVKKVLKR